MKANAGSCYLTIKNPDESIGYAGSVKRKLVDGSGQLVAYVPVRGTTENQDELTAIRLADSYNACLEFNNPCAIPFVVSALTEIVNLISSKSMDMITAVVLHRAFSALQRIQEFPTGEKNE